MRWLVVVAIGLAIAGVAARAATPVRGSDGPDTLVGTPGDDALYGRGGDDIVDGAGGDDVLDGGPGADDLRGGAGEDAASYAVSAGVTVTLDDRPGDGGAGESDNVHTDVEHLYGGRGADLLTGSAAPNTLDGAGGADRLTGGGGFDHLYGGDGDDVLDARDGGADEVDCGAGADRAIADAADLLVACEVREADTSRRATGVVAHRWVAFSTFTRVVRLDVTRLSRGDAVVTLTCRGGGCPFRSRRASGGRRRVSFTRAFRGRRLRPGARIQVLITAPGAPGRHLAFTMLRRKIPRLVTRCLEPGRATPVRCQ